MSDVKKPREWSLAIGVNTGKIYEIVEGLVPPNWILPPCSNQDLPKWTHTREVSPEYDALVEGIILELKGFVVRWEECDGRISAGVYCDSSRFRDAEQLLSKLSAYRAKEKSEWTI